MTRDLIQKTESINLNKIFTLIDVLGLLLQIMYFSSDNGLLFAFAIFPMKAFTLKKLVAKKIGWNLTIS